MASIKFNTIALSAITSGLLLSTLAPQVQAHGYMDSPKARQAICQVDGGYWWPETLRFSGGGKMKASTSGTDGKTHGIGLKELIGAGNIMGD